MACANQHRARLAKPGVDEVDVSGGEVVMKEAIGRNATYAGLDEVVCDPIQSCLSLLFSSLSREFSNFSCSN